MEQILEIAMDEFLHYGFKSVTVDDIARKCGISKKTFYERFKNKDELVNETVKQYNQQHWEEMCQMSKDAKNAVEELVSIFVHLGKMMKNINPICFSDMQRYYPEAFKYMECFKNEKILNSIKDNLIRGKQEELFREELDDEIIAQFRLNSVFMVMENNVFSKSPKGALYVNRQIMELYMYGVATVKGHKLVSKYLSDIKNQ